MSSENHIDWQHFTQVDMRVGTIVSAEVFEEARNPAYKLKVDFGPELGIKKSSAQITVLYTPEELIGKQVIAVVNFPPKQIANLMSECLVMGVPGEKEGSVILLTPQQNAQNGVRVY